jgi:hypothetical protein
MDYILVVSALFFGDDSIFLCLLSFHCLIILLRIWIFSITNNTKQSIFVELIFFRLYCCIGALRGLGMRSELSNARKTLRYSICHF